MARIKEDDDNPKLTYTQIEVIENEGKKLTGTHVEKWVDNKSLCSTCQHAHIMRRTSTNSRAVKCQEIGSFVPEDIKECNSYLNFTQLSLSQMAQLATLVGGLPERKVGFRKE